MSKTYRQFCGLARGLDVVGGRWTLLIVRNLLLGPKRFGDLEAQLPGIATNLLAKRMREMQDLGLVVKSVLAAPANVAVYELTDSGRALEPVVMEIARWGGRFMDAPRKDDALDIGWALLSTKRRYRGGATLSVELAIDARTFAMDLEPTYLRVEERCNPSATLRLSGSLEQVRGCLFGGPMERSRFDDTGVIVVRGTDADLGRFLGSFGPAEPWPTQRALG